MLVKEQGKAESVFGRQGIIVDKSLGLYNDQFRKLPSYVVDFLISQMVDSNNPTSGLTRISKLLKDHFMDANQKDLVKSKIREQGEYTLIGRIRCRYDEAKDQYWVDVAALGNQYARIDLHVLQQYQDILLTTGAWGVFKIVYDESYVVRNKLYPFLITEFKPMQITGIDVDSWVKKRNQFSDSEWMSLMIMSFGFDPDTLSEEEKLLYMARMVPFIEANVNMIELGPPETGKTFAFQSISSHGFVISGSQTTVPSLFYDKLRSKTGLICYKDVVMFDEIAGSISNNKWSNQAEMIDMLKDFMNSGKFGRGSIELSSECSLMFAGNIDCDRQNKQVSSRYRSLFTPLPNVLKNDRAFIDRFHGFIPGWRLPQIRESNLAKGKGFMADYISEVMHQMRDRSYVNVVLHNVDLGNMSQRNQRSMVRIASGLIKLIYPHRNEETITRDELNSVLSVATELRQLVVDQLAVIMPGEFRGVKLSYELKGEINDR